MNLGRVFREQDKLPEAVDSYKKGVALNPDDANLRFNLGIAYWFLGKLDDAEKSLRKAIELKPDYPLAYNRLIQVLIKEGKQEQANSVLAQAKRMGLRP